MLQLLALQTAAPPLTETMQLFRSSADGGKRGLGATLSGVDQFFLKFWPRAQLFCKEVRILLHRHVCTVLQVDHPADAS